MAMTIKNVVLRAMVLVALAPCVSAEEIALSLRSRNADGVVEKPAKWEAKETAVVVIDVWDKHWCEGANRRVGEMVGRMEQFVSAMRAKGAVVVHAPSDTMKTYEGTPGRMLAKAAPRAESPVPIKGWRYIDEKREGKLPIDDSDGGCDCEPQCKNHKAWTGQHPAIRIVEGAAVSDNGQEIYNLFRQRGVKHVIIFGVHTNMCILGRTFGIRQTVDNGFDVALVRDLTDTMYNPRKAPFVPHEKVTELVIEHVEKNWCPTITSAMVLGEGTVPRR